MANKRYSILNFKFDVKNVVIKRFHKKRREKKNKIRKHLVSIRNG